MAQRKGHPLLSTSLDIRQSPDLVPVFLGGFEQTRQSFVLSPVKTDFTDAPAWGTACNGRGWLNPASAAEHTSARDDASLCLQSRPENAHSMRLLLKMEEVKPSLGKQVTLVCNGYQFPIVGQPFSSCHSKVMPPLPWTNLHLLNSKKGP